MLPKTKITGFGDPAYSSFMFPKQLHMTVKKRIEKASNLLVESGHLYKQFTDVASSIAVTLNVEKELIIYCLDNMNGKTESQKLDVVFQLRFLLFFMKAASAGFLVAITVLIFETVKGKMMRPRNSFHP